MNDKDIIAKAEEARLCLKRAVHDVVRKGVLQGQDLIVNEEGRPKRISSIEAAQRLGSDFALTSDEIVAYVREGRSRYGE